MPIPIRPRTTTVVAAALVVVALAACGDDDAADAVDGATSAPDTVEEDAPVGDETSTGDGCISLVVPDGWETTVVRPEAGLGFSIGDGTTLERPPERGEPGVYVELACPRLDSVGTAGPVAIPGAEVVEQESIAVGGDEGLLLLYEFEGDEPDLEMAALQVSIDTGDVRCTLRADGTSTAVEDARTDLDAAIASMTCLGR